jgi:hypothetical protein
MRATPLLIVLALLGLNHGQTRSKSFSTFWLNDTEPTTAVLYDPLLLVTSVPLDELQNNAILQDSLKRLPSRLKKENNYVLDIPALFIGHTRKIPFGTLTGS